MAATACAAYRALLVLVDKMLMIAALLAASAVAVFAFAAWRRRGPGCGSDGCSTPDEEGAACLCDCVRT